MYFVLHLAKARSVRLGERDVKADTFLFSLSKTDLRSRFSRTDLWSVGLGMYGLSNRGYELAEFLCSSNSLSSVALTRTHPFLPTIVALDI